MSADVALLAGGLATRLGPLTRSTPKSLLDVAGRPFIEQQLRLFAAQGIARALVCAGHLGEAIQARIGDGAGLGIRVDYAFDGPRPLGTGGALKQALPQLSDPFYVVYGDSYLCEPMAPALAALQADPAADAVMTVYANEDRWDASNVRFKDGRIEAYDKSGREPGMRHIDYGLGVFRHRPLADEPAAAFDLAGLYARLLAQGRLKAHLAHERFYEIGSQAGLEETRRFLEGL